MSISAAMNTAMAGMNFQTGRLSSAADTIASQGAPQSQNTPPEPTGSDQDMLDAMTDMMDAETSFKANVAAFETGASMWDALMAINRD